VSKEIVRHIIREETDSQNRRINYGKVGQAVFNRQHPNQNHHQIKKLVT
jgi:hypothetical protein